MRNTPVANIALAFIESTLIFIEAQKISVDLSMEEIEALFIQIKGYSDNLLRIDMEGTKEEFWALAEELDYPASLRDMYEVKFKNLLNLESLPLFEMKNRESELEKLMLQFISNFNKKMQKFKQDDSVKLITNYYILIFILSYIKKNIISMLDEYSAFIKTQNKPITQESEIVSSAYTIPKGLRTNFIKYLSAMYDLKMFVDKEEGKPATNKQKLMETFGNFLNVDFSTYSTSLSNAKDKDMETFLRPFREIEKAARRYFMEGYNNE
jgi:hypothetical protein